MPRPRRLLPACLALALLAPGSALAAGPPPRTNGLETVLQDDAQILHRPPAEIRGSLERMRGLGVDRLRVTANWSVITREASSEERPSFDAADPAAYEQGRWGDLDRAVRLAAEQRMPVMIDIAFFAPRWASTDAPGERGRSNVDPAEFAAFATAVARRYTGSFVPPADTEPVEPNEDEQFLDDVLGGVGAGSDPQAPAPIGEPLPRVDVYTLWNEPNHTGFLRPQWVPERGGGFRARSPEIYRDMVFRAYPAIKAVDPDVRVLIGGTSGSGAYRNRGTGGVAPLRFLRELACVDAKYRPRPTRSCQGFRSLPGDGWSHHPYSMKGTPDKRSGPNQPDDVPMAELPRLVKTLDRLADAGRISPALREIWVTEYGYETNPPSTISRYGAADQARFLPWGEYMAWRIPEVRTFAQFLLRDLPPGPERVGSSRLRPFGEWYSGLEYEDGRPKLATEAFRAGLFAQRLRGRTLRLWARLRLGGGPRRVAVEVQRRGTAPWRPLTTWAPDGTGKAPEVVVDGRSVLNRRARTPSATSALYRLRYDDSGTVRYTQPVEAVGRPVVAKKPRRAKSRREKKPRRARPARPARPRR